MQPHNQYFEFLMTKQDLANAKNAFDHAWAKAEKHGEEAKKDFDIDDEIMSRDTGDMYIEKAKRAMQADDNWMQAAQRASMIMNEYYGQFSPK